MGNSLGCSALGERLVSAARDGDPQEVRALLDCNPSLAKYSTFGSLNSPLHFAAAKGHYEIVTLLLEHGADVNARNYCGQTALMQACRHGHWEVVLTFLLYNANVCIEDYLNCRTAFHFAAFNGHANCIRILVADYVPSAPYDWNEQRLLSSEKSKASSSNGPPDIKNALSKLVSRAADGGITALHMAALNRHLDCVLLLLDLLADVSATTYLYGNAIDSIGPGSTSLHYAACGGSIQCCQALISRGASRTAINCNGWLPWDVARYCGRQWLEPLLAPNSQLSIPDFPTSRFLSLPLKSAMEIARECGWRENDSLVDGTDLCAVCLERKCTIAATGCGHELCTKCSLYLCAANTSCSPALGPPGSIPCPLCRHGIISFTKLPATKHVEETGKSFSLSLCTACSADECDGMTSSGPIPRPGGIRIPPVSSESFRKITCTGFPSVNLQLCSCSESARVVSPSIQSCGTSVPVENAVTN